MSDYIDKEEHYIGSVLPGQGWVELRGIFTIGELEALMAKIRSQYSEAKDDNTRRHNS
jgi:hypothetical protein